MNVDVPGLEVQLEVFEGPLAVLINLIKKNKIDIFDIPIAMITERFLVYVEVVKDMQLKIAEDFIEMASLLIYIKSRMLLPRQEEDPREELIEKILEYEKIKSMVGQLERLPVLGHDTFVRGSAAVVEEEEEDLHTLCALFFELLRDKAEKFIEIREIRPTLEERLAEIKQVLDEEGSYTWTGEENTLSEKVATVLAMLEITKLRLASLTQRRTFGAITLKRR
jgi:segregation and condensation protein A